MSEKEKGKKREDKYSTYKFLPSNSLFSFAAYIFCNNILNVKYI
jgi:hypothetical protein